MLNLKYCWLKVRIVLMFSYTHYSSLLYFIMKNAKKRINGFRPYFILLCIYGLAVTVQNVLDI